MMAQRFKNQLVSIRMLDQCLTSQSGLRIQCCCEPWCRSQMQLRSCVAVAVVYDGSCSSNFTPRLGTSIKSKKRKKRRKEKETERKKRKERGKKKEKVLIILGDYKFLGNSGSFMFSYI